MTALSPYTPPTAREEAQWARAEAIHEHRKAVAFERLATTQRGAEQVIAEALGYDFESFDANRHMPDVPVVVAVASWYAHSMRCAARLPRGVAGLDSYAFSLCTAVSATLDRLVERDAEASDDEPVNTTHTPNLDALDPVAREILGDVLTGLFRIHPVTPPVAPEDDSEPQAEKAK